MSQLTFPSTILTGIPGYEDHAHALLSPSGADRWAKCPGSVSAIASLPPREERNADNFYAREGQVGHEIIATRLRGDLTSDSCWEFLGRVIDGVEVTRDLIIACEACVAAVYAWEASYRKEGYTVDTQVEKRVSPGRVLIPNNPEACFGTADVILRVYADKGRVLKALHCLDHKLGRGHLVKPETLQLQLYLIGAVAQALTEFPAVIQAADIAFRATILQPRHPLGGETWGVGVTYTHQDLMNMIEELSLKAQQALSLDAPRIPGESQCRWCDYRGMCPELKEYALNHAAQVFTGQHMKQGDLDVNATAKPDTDDVRLAESNYTRDPKSLTLEEIESILESMPLIRAWLNSVEEHAHELLMKGTEMKNHKLVLSRGSKSWATNADDDPFAWAVLPNLVRTKEHGGGKLRKGDYVVETLISPAQAKKTIKPLVSAKSWRRVEEIISYQKGKPVIAHREDPREEYVRAPTKVFEATTITATEEDPNPLNLDALN